MLTMLITNGVWAMTENENKLLGLATRELGKLTDAEIIFFRLVALSSPIDYSKGGDKNPVNANKWGQDRTIRALCIEWLCSNTEAASLVSNQNGINIIGARITEQIRLPYTKIPFPLIFLNCSIPQGFYLRNADIQELILDNSHIGPLQAGNMKTAGSIHLEHTKVDGSVDLNGAVVNGNIQCNGGHFINPGKLTITANYLKINGDLQFNDGFISEGEISLKSARISGDLQCVQAKFINKGKTTLLGQEIEIKGCILMYGGFVSEGLVDFRYAVINGGFEALQAHFSNEAKDNNIALVIEVAKIGGPLFLDGVTVNGQLKLDSSIIGLIQCDGGTFVNEGKNAIFAQHLQVNGPVLLRDATIKGEVNLSDAKIDGLLECDRSQFSNKGGMALIAERLYASGGVHLHDNFKAEGEVRLVNAILDDDFLCTKGHFLNENGNALQAEHIKIKGKAFLGSVEVNGLVSFALAEIEGHFKWIDAVLYEKTTLDLRYAKIGTLWDDEKSWPMKNHLWINGLVYGAIDSQAPRSFNSRIKWLKLQPTERFYPQPYEQLAIDYKKNAQDENTKMVLIEKNRDITWLSQMTSWEKLWHRFLGITIGFGYRPIKALYWAFLFIAIGWGFFAIADKANIMTPSKEGAYISKAGAVDRRLSDDYPKFNPLVYSVDLFIPIIDLHMKLS
jgi:cytoskeletal protein CcmA (bactofilin family)